MTNKNLPAGFEAWRKKEYPHTSAISDGIAIAREAWEAAIASIASGLNPHIGHEALADAWQRGFNGIGYGWSRLPLEEYEATYQQGEQARAALARKRIQENEPSPPPQKYLVLAVAIDLTALPIKDFPPVREEVVSTENEKFKGCRTINDVEIAYEQFWNFPNNPGVLHNRKEKIKVLSVVPILNEETK